MNKTTKNIILVSVLVVVAGIIWYLESHKTNVALDPSQVERIALTEPEMSTSTTTASTTMTVKSASVDRSTQLKAKAQEYPSAVELIPGGKFINTDPFTLKSLVGKKVILVDFWTYSCINCQRTTPYLNAWYEKYKDQGLVIVGVHAPEFGFEKEYANVVQGVKDLGIKYPVVQDNNMATWNAYQNRYWPHEYLIDIDGFIVHDKIGEGGYTDTEKAIQRALQERQTVLKLGGKIDTSIVNPKDAVSMTQGQVQSPEVYFGAARNEFLGNGDKGKIGTQAFIVPESKIENTLYLGGSWNVQNEYAETTNASEKIVFTYNAKNVYFVGSAATPVDVKIYLDGVYTKTITVQQNKLYKIIEGTQYGKHILQMEIGGAGLQAFTFTFG